MNANDRIRVGGPLPRLASVRPDGGQRVRVRWASGPRKDREESVDLSPLIELHKFYAPLRKDTALFDSVHLADERGTALEWGDGELDMAATSVARLAEEAMNSDDFCSFLQRHDLTQQGAAVVLGRSRRHIINYLQGTPIPRVVALACIGYEHRTTTLGRASEHLEQKITCTMPNHIVWSVSARAEERESTDR